MSLCKVLWHAFWARYFEVALSHMHIDHPDVPHVYIKYALHRARVELFLQSGR